MFIAHYSARMQIRWSNVLRAGNLQIKALKAPTLQVRTQYDISSLSKSNYEIIRFQMSSSVIIWCLWFSGHWLLLCGSDFVRGDFHKIGPALHCIWLAQISVANTIPMKLHMHVRDALGYTESPRTPKSVHGERHSSTARDH